MDFDEHSNGKKDVFVIAQQGLHKAKAFSSFHTALLARKLGVHWKLGGDTARTIDSNQPKRYSRPYGIVLSIQSGEGRSKKEEIRQTFGVMGFALLEMAEHLPAHGKKLIPCFSLLLLSLINCNYLNSQVF